jgi:hypothetical protein
MKLIIESHETNVSRYTLDLNKDNFEAIRDWLASGSDYSDPILVKSVDELASIVESNPEIAALLHAALSSEIDVHSEFENINLDDTHYYATCA